MAKKILNLFWPLIIGTTVILYVLLIIFLPVNTRVATILLFVLIGYWSRIPGVGVPSPFYILYRADVVDLLSILIAVNIGPVQGASYSIFCNFLPRVAGTQPYWRGVIRDTIIQAVCCLIIPFFYHILNQNIFHTVLAFTALTRVGWIIGHLIIPEESNFQFVFIWVGATAAIFFVNYVYGKYFGDFFDGLLQKGVEFNWTLFTFASLIIFFLWYYFFNKDLDPDNKSFSEKIEGWIKLRVYLIVSSMKQKKIRHLMKNVIQRYNESTKEPEKLVKKSQKIAIAEDLMHIENPEDIALSFFENSNDEAILKGSIVAFNYRVFFIIIGMIFITCIFNKYTPNLIETIMVIGFGILLVIIEIGFIKSFIGFIIRLIP